ncbi:MAG: UDP-phosphate galactose phosphotransferase [Spirochaetes bacterium]|nr:MAG: UDP-phosphate galactose phosphotransferase [Spirochaetota bacterium]
MFHNTQALQSAVNAKHGRLRMATLFAVSDLAAVLISFGIGFFIVNALDKTAINFKSFVLYWPYLPFFILELWIFGLYPGIAYAQAEELRRFALASFIGHAGVLIALSIQERDDLYISLAFTLSFVASIPLFVGIRAMARRHFSTSRFWGVPAAVFGGGKIGRSVVDKLLDKPAIGLVPAAIFDDNAKPGERYRGIPIFRGLTQGEEFRRKSGINTAIAATPKAGAYLSGFKYSITVPNLEGMPSLWTSVRDMDGILGLYNDRNLLKPSNLFLKRVMDISLSLILGLLALPLMAVIALLVRLGSPGPAFYAHTRLGRFGRPIKVYKFRTMYRDADARLKTLLAQDSAIREEWEVEG